MDMQKNWHTYWKNPGDSGGPIKVIWNLPENVTIEGPFWPTPELLPYPPLMTYGYKDFVIFPYKVSYTDIDNLSFVGADIDFLICDDVCVPEKANINPFEYKRISKSPFKFKQTNPTSAFFQNIMVVKPP